MVVAKSKQEKDRLDPKVIRNALGASLFTGNIIYHKRLDSTNRLAHDLGAQGVAEGALVLAEEQTGGKGRMGRTWVSPGYANLLCSVLLRPAMQVDQVFVLTMILALAAIDGVEKVCGIRPLIKWPNDLYVVGKKLAGMLSEFSAKGKFVEYIVLGLGLNVNWNPEDEDGLLYPTTSLWAETGRVVSRNDLLIAILDRLERSYRDIQAGEKDFYHERWNKLSMVIGRHVEIVSTKERLSGKAVRIEKDGALIIASEGGLERRILSGDVSLRL